MPRFIQWLYPERIWAFSRSSNSVFLTFDDGPIPELTPWVLDELKKHNAKATFFCIGENIQKHPEIFQRILSEGHSVGNHTFNHLKGTKTETSKYIENILIAEKLIDSKLFRPPYGKITSKQAKILQSKGFKIVMWDIISYDYDATISEEKCLQNVLKNIKPGCIVVFHDSIKAEKNLRFALQKVLGIISERGWKCNPILH
ncbi:MAG: polysaccharide deacetylase family protein [Aequorivita sp.]|nr:polysaccharide deacetylase family protein [Aequorivita sp.]MCB0455105.1 polysaccharide deacetylase family protein [Aequorivita sp.]HPE82110.1 polysaccharide deacetylase family protein [Aequorivita sp.]